MGGRPNEASRGVFLDYVVVAKGVAIAFVVWGHAVDQILNAEAYEHVRALNLWLQTVIYSFHMPLFFALSGLLAGLPKGDGRQADSYGSMLKKRSLRLLLPYLVVSLIQVPARAMGRDHISLSDLPGAVLTILYEPSVQLWFVYALFIMFAILPLLEWVAGRKAWLVVLMLLAGSALSSYVPFSYCEVRTVLVNTIYFFLGVLLGRRHGRGDGWDGVRRYFWLSVAAFAVLANVRFMTRMGVIDIPQGPVRSLITCAAGTAGLLVFIRLSQLMSRHTFSGLARCLRVLGHYSYDIYLFHYIIMGSINVLFMRRGLPYVALVAAMVLPAIVGCLLWGRMVLDRSKTLALICRGQRSRPTSAVAVEAAASQANEGDDRRP